MNLKKCINTVSKNIGIKIESNGLKKTLLIGLFRVRIPYCVTRRLINKNYKLKKHHYNTRYLWESDKELEKELCRLYEERVGNTPNLQNPLKFTEKINWLKLHYKNDLITECCDKYAVKIYLEKIFSGKNYTIPTLQAWENVDEMNFKGLPNQFVLKVNWSSGYNIFINDKSMLSERDYREIYRQIALWMKPESNSYYDSFNWGYYNMKPVVYAEQFLPREFVKCEYKVFVFQGRAEYVLLEIKTDEKKHQRVCLDRNASEVNLCFGNYEKAEIYQITEKFTLLLDLAEKASKEFIFTRVDFYVHERKIYIGEMTFYSGGGFSQISPSEWEYILGEKLKINN